MNDPRIPQMEAVPAVPERTAETPESGGAFEAPKPVERPEPAAPVMTPNPAPVPVAPQAPAKDPDLRDVEGIMEEGVREAYLAMPEGLRRKFKLHGEKVSHAIAVMVKTLKVVPSKVLELIRGWLKMIPGVDRFFLIQEAKIKTDKIVALAERKKTGSP